MKRMVKAGLALGMSFCLVVSGMALSEDVSAKKKVVQPKKITLNKGKVTLKKKGQTFKIKIKKVTPKKASKKVSAFKFKSSNKKVATVSKKGVIKAVKNGSCKVTVTSKTKKKVKATIKVTVKIAGTPTPTQQPPAPTATAPATGAPTTGAPTTGAPTTGAPTTGAPTTGAPTTGAPTTDAPPATTTTAPPATTTTAPPATTTTAPPATTTTAPPQKTTVPVVAGEKVIDGVTFKTYSMEAGSDYAIMTEKADGTKEKTEIPVTELGNLLSKVTGIANTYQRWMEVGSYTKTIDNVTYKIETPDDSAMAAKKVTVSGSNNSRLNGVFNVTLTAQASAVYQAVIKKEEASSEPVTLTIADGSDSVVVTGDYNGAKYRVEVAKDNSQVDLFKGATYESMDRIAQITKDAAGYEMCLQKAEVESRKIVVEKLGVSAPSDDVIEIDITKNITVAGWGNPAITEVQNDGSVKITWSADATNYTYAKFNFDSMDLTGYKCVIDAEGCIATVEIHDASKTEPAYNNPLSCIAPQYGKTFPFEIQLNEANLNAKQLADQDGVMHPVEPDYEHVAGVNIAKGTQKEELVLVVKSIKFIKEKPAATAAPATEAPATAAPATEAPATEAPATAAPATTTTAPPATTTTAPPATTTTAPPATTTTAPPATTTAPPQDLTVPLTQTEYQPTLDHFQVVGYVDIDGAKLEAGQKIQITYSADCAAAVKFQREVREIPEGHSQTLGTWANSDGMVQIGYSADWAAPATSEVIVNQLPASGKDMRIFFSTNTAANEIKSFEITSVKVLKDNEEVSDAVAAKSDKYVFPGIVNYGPIAIVSLKDYYDPSKYTGVSVKYMVEGDNLDTQVKVTGSKDCKTPIGPENYNAKVAAIEYANSMGVTKTLSFAGLADDDMEPSVAIHYGKETPGFTGKVTIQEIKLIAKK